MNPQHLSGSASWGTPQDIIESARTVLGGIDLDPASSEKFNERVQARDFMTPETFYGEGALTSSWFVAGPDGRPTPGSVFLNPPGGFLSEGGQPIVKHPDGSWYPYSADLLDVKPKYTGKRIPAFGACWRKLMQEVEAGHVLHAVVIVFNLNALQSTQGWEEKGGPETVPSCFDFPICIPAKRLRYTDENGKPGPSPTHASAIVYVPGDGSGGRGGLSGVERFEREFSKYGRVRL